MTTVSVGLPTFGQPSVAGTPGWPALPELARRIEAAGADRIVVPDHVVLGRRTDEYAWGRFPTAPDVDWLEPLIVLAAVAATTTTVRLATGILVAPLRPAAVLAKQVATLDVLSAGRVDLGVGTGWQSEEYDAVGRDFANRGALLTDTIAACRALWTDSPAAHTGPAADFEAIYCFPRPAQERLPIWFSGTLLKRTVERIATLGDGWLPIMDATPEQIRDGAATLRAAYESRGRDPETLQVQARLSLVRDAGAVDLDATVAAARSAAEGGATDLNIHLSAFRTPAEDALATLARLASGIHEL